MTDAKPDARPWWFTLSLMVSIPVLAFYTGQIIHATGGSAGFLGLLSLVMLVLTCLNFKAGLRAKIFLWAITGAAFVAGFLR